MPRLQCGQGLVDANRYGAHGFLPSRPTMSTGFIAVGSGIRAGMALERMGLVDVAPIAARLLGLAMPASPSCGGEPLDLMAARISANACGLFGIP